MDGADVLDVEAGEAAEGLDPGGVLLHHVQLQRGVVPLLRAGRLARLEPLQPRHLLLQVLHHHGQELLEVGVHLLESVVLLGQLGHVVVELRVLLLVAVSRPPDSLEGAAKPGSGPAPLAPAPAPAPRPRPPPPA